MTTSRTTGAHPFYIIHLADIHIRDNGREKFRAAIARLSVFVRAIPDDRRAIAIIAGDIFHYKTRLSGENIQDCYALLDCIALRASDIIVIPGNHDANLNNDTRIDLLTPILKNCRALAAGHCALHYWAHSGWQEPIYDDLQFYVFSPLSAPSPPGPIPTPMRADSRPARIAIVHDFIEGLRIQGSAGHGPIKQEWLTPFDCVMCGHAHDYQAFSRASLDARGSIVYCGALTQLSIGESFDKGFVMWDIVPSGDPTEKKPIVQHRFIRLEVPGALVKYAVSRASGAAIRTSCNISCESIVRAIPRDSARVVIEIRARVPSDCDEVRALADSIRAQTDAPIEFAVAADNVAASVAQRVSAGATMQVQQDLIADKLRAANPQIDDPTVQAVLAMHAETMHAIMSADGSPSGASSASGVVSKWSLVLLEWGDLFCYSGTNYINFTQIGGIAGLIAPNRCGKSSVIDILTLALFNQTLRGSAYSIIRRGRREGFLRCLWDADMVASDGSMRRARHEVIRRWDLKEHTTHQYFIDGRNCTELNLKSTYIAIGRSVGTIEDFLSAILMPQHAEESFLDATDMHRRAIIARILGLDLLDAALSHVKEREREYQGAIKALSSVIQSAVARIEAARPDAGTAGSAVRTARELLDQDARVIEGNYQKRIIEARDHVHGTKKRLEDLEGIPPVAAPIRTVDAIERELRANAARVTQLEGEIKILDERIAAGRADLALLLAGSASLALDSVDADRAKLAQLTTKLDQQMLLMGRAKGTRVEDVPAQISIATKQLTTLLSMKDALRELMELSTPTAGPRSPSVPDARAACPPEIAKKYPNELIEKMTIEEVRATLASIPKSETGLPTHCRCIARKWSADQSTEREARLDALLRQTFAAGVNLPGIVPRNFTECASKLKDLVRDVRAEAAFDIAHHAIQLVRLSATEQHGNTETSDLEDARFCHDHHAEIAASNARAAEIALLSAINDNITSKVRAQRKRTLREQLEIATAEVQCLLSLPAATAGQRKPIPVMRVIDEGIFKCERALSLLGELQKNSARIREALAIDAEVAALRSRIDTGFSIQRITLRVDSDVRTAAQSRAKVAEITASADALRAQIEPTVAAHKDYALFQARMGEIKSLRESFAREQTAYLSLVAEASEYSRMREGLTEANRKIAHYHQMNHICELYKMTLDTKTGIQYNLMMSAISLIETEANRFLEPIARLKLCINLGTTNTAVSAVAEAALISRGSGASPLAAAAVLSCVAPTSDVPHIARGNVSKTMSVSVRDAQTDISHPAELCSGFQRFILNIALRRAFLRTAVRPMPQFMIIDEGFGCLDEANMTKVCEYLPELARELRFMLIVSHIDTLNTMITVPLVIDVDSRGGTSGSSISALHFGEFIAQEARASTIEPDGDVAGAIAASGSQIATTRARNPKKSRQKEPAEANAIDPAIVDKRADGTLFCKICGKDFKIWSRHKQSKKHIQNAPSAH